MAVLALGTHHSSSSSCHSVGLYVDPTTRHRPSSRHLPFPYLWAVVAMQSYLGSDVRLLVSYDKRVLQASSEVTATKAACFQIAATGMMIKACIAMTAANQGQQISVSLQAGVPSCMSGLLGAELVDPNSVNVMRGPGKLLGFGARLGAYWHGAALSFCLACGTKR